MRIPPRIDTSLIMLLDDQHNQPYILGQTHIGQYPPQQRLQLLTNQSGPANRSDPTKNSKRRVAIRNHVPWTLSSVK